MRFWSLVVFLALMTSAATANLLENGDLSDWDDPTQPTGWVVEDTLRALVNRNTNPVHSPPYSAKITRLVEGPGDNKGIKQEYIPIASVQEHTLTVWFYDDDENTNGGLGISYFDADTVYISHSGTAYTDSAIHTWQQVVKTHTSPAAAAFARVTLRVYGFTGSQPGGIVYVDDVEYVEGGPGVTERRPTSPGAGTNLAIEPNPASGRTRFSIETSLPRQIQLNVYDLTGSHRASVYSGELPATRHTVTWNGADRDGNPLPDGLYFAVLSDTAGWTVVRKLVIRH